MRHPTANRTLRMMGRTPARHHASALARVLYLVLLLLAADRHALALQASRPIDKPYVLQVGDQVSISVLPRKEFDSSATVLPDGMLYLKNLLGIKALGMTVPELQERLIAELTRTLKRPRVTVNLDKVAAPKPEKVTIIGGVLHPGVLDFEPGLRVRKAIELSSGATKNADLTQVTITHKDLKKTIVDLSRDETGPDPRHNILLADGDTVEVPQVPEKTITLVGAIGRTGAMPIEEGLRLWKAIELASGPGPNADLSKVVVTHRDLTRVVVDVSTPARVADLSQNLLLRDGDSVEIPQVYKTGVVAIRGAITTEGNYDLKPEMGLAELITAAGRLLLTADVESIELRHSSGQTEKLNLVELNKQGLDARIRLRPGDEVYIPFVKNTIMVVGPIPAPGPRRLKDGVTIRDFFYSEYPDLLAALDPSKVDYGAIQVLRAGKKPMPVKLKKVLAKPKRKDNYVLRAGDVIFLGASRAGGLGFQGLITTLPYLSTLFSLFRF